MRQGWGKENPAFRHIFTSLFIPGGTPEQMADEMRTYVDAGFTGFTFNNSLYRTPEQIARVGELLALIT